MKTFWTAARILLIGFFVSATLSCGKFQEKFGRIKAGESRLSFAFPHSAIAAGTLTKGVMIYIYNESAAYATTVKLADETAAAGKSITVPNGTYKVLAVGWSGANEFNETVGSLRCGKGNGGAIIPLSGQTTTVLITMSDAGCDFGNSAGNIFYPADISVGYSTNSGPGRIKPIWLRLCADGSYSGSAPAAISCTTPSVTYNNTYTKVSLMGYVRANGGVQVLPADAAITGQCVINSGNVSLGQVPLGNSGYPEIFYLRISIYGSGDSTCAAAPIKVLDFKDGLYGNSSSEFPRPAYGPSAGQSYYLLNAGG